MSPPPPSLRVNLNKTASHRACIQARNIKFGLNADITFWNLVSMENNIKANKKIPFIFRDNFSF